VSVSGPVKTNQTWATVEGSGAAAILALANPPCGASDVVLTIGSLKQTIHIVVQDDITSLSAVPSALTILRGGRGAVKVQKVSGTCPVKEALSAAATAPLGASVIDEDAAATVIVDADPGSLAPDTQNVLLTCGELGLTVPVTISDQVSGTFLEGGVGWTVSVDGTAHASSLRADGSFSVFADSAPYALTLKNSQSQRLYHYKNLWLATPLLPASLALTSNSSEARAHVTLTPGAGLVAAFSSAGAHGDWFTSDASGWSGSDGAPSATDGVDARWLLGPPAIAGWLDILQTTGGFALARIPLSLLNGAATSAQMTLQPTAAETLSVSAQLPQGYAMDTRTVFAVVDAGAGLPVSSDPEPDTLTLPQGAHVAVSASASAATRDLLLFVANADPAQPLVLRFPVPITALTTTSGNASTILTWVGPANAAYAIDFIQAGIPACSVWTETPQVALSDCALAAGVYTLQVTAIGPAASLDDLMAGIADPARLGKRLPNASNFFAMAPPMAFTVTP
jgi:hypothetical protein